MVIAGRRKKLLDETVAANPGMKAAVLDIENSDAMRTFAEKLKKDYPALNVVIHNAGIMKPEPLQDGAVADAEAMVTTNLLGPIRLNAALLPFLLKQQNPVIMTVSSGLAFVPLAMTPTYCATKAAIHSYTQSLRYQLKDTRGTGPRTHSALRADGIDWDRGRQAIRMPCRSRTSFPKL